MRTSTRTRCRTSTSIWRGHVSRTQSEGDAILAQLAVIEGDATLTSQEWALANLTLEERLQLVGDAAGELSGNDLAGMPLILRRQLEFPYTEGFLFTNDIYDNGGYDAVNNALVTPPASTEQILHSEKYFDQEPPVSVTLDDLSATLGDGWSSVYDQTMGELNIQVLATGGETPALNIPGFPTDVAAPGGRCGLGRRPPGDVRERRPVAHRLADDLGHGARRHRVREPNCASSSRPSKGSAHRFRLMLSPFGSSSPPMRACSTPSVAAPRPSRPLHRLRRAYSKHVERRGEGGARRIDQCEPLG